MVDVVDSIIHDLILQLVKSDKAYQDSGISRLLPIETVYKGYGLHNGVLKIPFACAFRKPYPLQNLHQNIEFTKFLRSQNAYNLPK